MINSFSTSAASPLTCFVRAGSAPTVRTGEQRVYHAIAQAREREEMSIQKCAEGLGISVAEAKKQEESTTPLTAAQLSEWKRVLKVPYSELLGMDDDELDDPVRHRAGMLRIMKTAKSLKETVRDPSDLVLVDNLIGQIVELMPEVETVSAWPKVGKSHEKGRLGRAATDEYALATTRGSRA